MNKKKIITIVIVAILVIGGVIGTVLGVQAHQTNKEYEQLAQNVADCKRMVENINYVYFPEDDTAKQARQRDLDKLKTYEEEIESKDMTNEQKSEFSEYCKTLKKNFEQCATDTKAQLDAVQASKDSHTEEGYYTDEFNNEWNGFINQFNENYNNEKYYDAFKVVLTMQGKLNEYVAVKTQEAADKAEAERQAAEAEAAAAKTVKSNNSGTTTAKNGGSSKSGKSSSSSYSGESSDNGSSNESVSNEGTGSGTRPDIQAAKDIFNKLYEQYGITPNIHP